jgi:hypothetical protein
MIDSTYATGIWTDLVRTKKTLTLDDCLPPLDQVCYKHFNWSYDLNSVTNGSNVLRNLIQSIFHEKFEDTKGVIRCRNSRKDR